MGNSNNNITKFFNLSLAAVISSCLFLACTKKNTGGENVLNIPIKSNVKGLDPVTTSDLYSAYVVSQIYEPLYTYHYLKRPLQLKPNLAAELPQVSKDGLTHTIKIKQGVVFQDDACFANGKGREVTAEDYIYSWKRIADTANQSESFWLFDDRIVGLNEWREKKTKNEADYNTPIEGLQAPDKYTLVIKLKRPFYQLHYILTMQQTAVVAKEAVAKYGKEMINHPVGTGPFKLENWTRNNQVTLVKNPSFRTELYPSEGEAGDAEKGLLKNAGQKIPFVDKMVFYEMVEDQPRWLNFMKGNLDLMELTKDNYDSAVKDGKLAQELEQKGIHLFITPELDLTYISFNMDDPIFKNNDSLRKAMSLAYDSKTFIQKFYNGRAIPAQSPIPPGVDGYDPNFKNPYREYNVSKAKDYLKKAGYPEGKGLPEIEFSIYSGSTGRQIAEYFKNSMEQIGIKIKIVSTSWPQFTDKLRAKKAQIWGIAWGGDYPDAENFLQLLFGKNESPGQNNANFKNPEYDMLYKKASQLPQGPARDKVYQEMRNVAIENAPWIPDTHRLAYYLQHDWLENFKFHTVINDYFKYLKVDPKKRAEMKEKL